MTARTLVVGLGSPHGDDRIGWEVARVLTDRLPAEVCVRETAIPANLLDWLPEYAVCHLIDGCSLRGRLGTLHRWKWPAGDFATLSERFSTHGMSLIEALRFAERLQILPKDVTIWGVEIGNTRQAADLSAELSEQIPTLAETLAEEIGCA